VCLLLVLLGGFVLDVIAPKTKDIYYLCDYNNEYNKDSYIKGNNHNHSSHNVFNLVKYPHLTFAHVGVIFCIYCMLMRLRRIMIEKNSLLKIY
jgi:hypothetical protein